MPRRRFLQAFAAAPLCAAAVSRAVSWGPGWGIEHAHGTSYLFQHGSLAGACMTFVLLHPQSETGIVHSPTTPMASA